MSQLFSLGGAIKLASLTAILALSTAIPAHAASNCKGKSRTVCQASNSCSYVKAHKRKDGAKVKAFCRAKPGKSKSLSERVTRKKTSSKKVSLMDKEPTTKRSKTSKTSKTSSKPKTSKKSKTSSKPKTTKKSTKKSTAKKRTVKKTAAKKKS